MTTKNIEKGYQLQILSWENDSDCHSVKIINGLTQDDVLFLIEIASCFKSKNSVPKGFGNSEASADDIIAKYHLIKEKYPNISENLKINWNIGSEYEDENIPYFITEYLIGTTYESDSWRVFDSYQVFEIPLEIENVTNTFSKLLK